MLVVGLGNPGSRYLGTRHNVGFEVVDRLVERWEAVERPPTVVYRLWECRRGVDAHPVWLMKPQTYMNRSGRAISVFARHEGVAAEELIESERYRPLVVVDDMSLPVGRLRFRARGSDGGHNGLASIAAALAADDYHRLRIGVGPPPAEDWVGFVLAGFSDPERDVLEAVYDHAMAGLDTVLGRGMSRAMSEFNRVDLTPDDLDDEESSPS